MGMLGFSTKFQLQGVITRPIFVLETFKKMKIVGNFVSYNIINIKFQYDK